MSSWWPARCAPWPKLHASRRRRGRSSRRRRALPRAPRSPPSSVTLTSCEPQGSGLRELLEQRLTLLSAEPADPTGVADADLVHVAAGLDLAHAGERLEHTDDFHLADHVVALSRVEQLA